MTRYMVAYTCILDGENRRFICFPGQKSRAAAWRAWSYLHFGTHEVVMTSARVLKVSSKHPKYGKFLQNPPKTYW